VAADDLDPLALTALSYHTRGLLSCQHFLSLTPNSIHPTWTTQVMPETGTPMTGAGIDDRYIGLALAISSSFAIGTSIILTKKVGYRVTSIHLMAMDASIDDTIDLCSI
jgi:hypothetical protein